MDKFLRFFVFFLHSLWANKQFEDNSVENLRLLGELLIIKSKEYIFGDNIFAIICLRGANITGRKRLASTGDACRR